MSAVLCLLLSACSVYTPATPPSGFIHISDAVPDAILEIRYFSTYNFVGERIDGYEQPTALLTVEAAIALKAVSDDVKAQGYRLKYLMPTVPSVLSTILLPGQKRRKMYV